MPSPRSTTADLELPANTPEEDTAAAENDKGPAAWGRRAGEALTSDKWKGRGESVAKAIEWIKAKAQPKADAAYRMVYTEPLKQTVGKGAALQGPPEPPVDSQDEKMRQMQVMMDAIRYAQQKAEVDALKQKLAAAQ